MEALLNGDGITLRRDLVLEMLPTDRLEIRERGVTIEHVSGPAVPTIDGNVIRVTEIGKYGLVLNSEMDLQLLCFERETLDFIERQARGIGHGAVSARGVIRSLANHTEWFDGTAASLVNKSLAPYGG